MTRNSAEYERVPARTNSSVRHAVQFENLLTIVCVSSQLDGDEDSPNFDEDGQDEYNEIHMLV